MPDDVEIQVGDRLRAEATGQVYEVLGIDNNNVNVTGLPPCSKQKLKRDIEAGRLTKLAREPEDCRDE